MEELATLTLCSYVEVRFVISLKNKDGIGTNSMVYVSFIMLGLTAKCIQNLRCKILDESLRKTMFQFKMVLVMEQCLK